MDNTRRTQIFTGPESLLAPIRANSNGKNRAWCRSSLAQIHPSPDEITKLDRPFTTQDAKVANKYHIYQFSSNVAKIEHEIATAN